MASVRLLPDKAFNKVVAHLPGVIGSVAETAAEGAARASSILAAHQPGREPGSGGSHITVTHGSVDSFVNLVDPGGAAAAIEFGRLTGGRGTTRGVGAISGAF